jgi:hypothetical protein
LTGAGCSRQNTPFCGALTSYTPNLPEIMNIEMVKQNITE